MTTKMKTPKTEKNAVNEKKKEQTDKEADSTSNKLGKNFAKAKGKKRRRSITHNREDKKKCKKKVEKLRLSAKITHQLQCPYKNQRTIKEFGETLPPSSPSPSPTPPRSLLFYSDT